MQIFDLIQANPLIWILFIVYLVATSALAWMGHKKTSDLESFAVGKGDMNPVVVGITLASSIASSATFIINPGFVYAHGISALMHLGVAAGLGVILGLILLSLGFRRVGKRTRALTLPQWVGQRYQSQAMTVFFALVNLLSFTFVVLIVGGLSIVMQQALGLSNTASVLLIIGFVFSYIFIGGTYAHAYTNTLQGIIMVFIAAIIVASGVPLLLDGPILPRLAAIDPNLATGVNPKSALFGSVFSVYVSGFIIGFAIVAQPHILIKSLYVKSERALWQYLGVCLAISVLFTALLLVGLYAHLMGLTPEAFTDPATGLFRQDRVMAVYITQSFGPVMSAIITVALMAAGMSTLDGILVALSSIAANDLFLNITRDNLLRHKSDEAKQHTAHRAGQVILILFGVVALVLSLNPPKLLGIFGQLGVYGIVAAAITPILYGIASPGMGKRAATTAAISALIAHFGLYAWGAWAIKNEVNLVQVAQDNALLGLIFDTSAPNLGLANPGVTATYAILLSLMIALPAAVRGRSRRASDAPASVAPAP